jgi:hypothetical protein
MSLEQLFSATITRSYIGTHLRPAYSRADLAMRWVDSEIARRNTLGKIGDACGGYGGP